LDFGAPGANENATIGAASARLKIPESSLETIFRSKSWRTGVGSLPFFRQKKGMAGLIQSDWDRLSLVECFSALWRIFDPDLAVRQGKQHWNS